MNLCIWCKQEKPVTIYSPPFDIERLELCVDCLLLVKSMCEDDRTLEARGFVVFSRYGVRYRTAVPRVNCEEADCEWCTDPECGPQECHCHAWDFTYPEDVAGLDYIETPFDLWLATRQTK